MYYVVRLGPMLQEGFENGTLREDLWEIVYVLCLSKKTLVGMGSVHSLELYESLLYSEKESFLCLQ